MKKLKIAMDFDGVIGNYENGWLGAHLIKDAPVDGVIEWMTQALADGHKIIIFSMRNADNAYINDIDFEISQLDRGLGAVPTNEIPRKVVSISIDIGAIFKAQCAILDWLFDNGMPYKYVEKIKFSVGKPHFDVLIDDKCFRFENNGFPDLSNLDPWWKK